MLNTRSRGFDINVAIWWNTFFKFSKEIGNSFAKINNAKVNSTPCQTSETDLFPQVATGFRGKLINLLCI